jgi:hypothetical protein
VLRHNPTPTEGDEVEIARFTNLPNLSIDDFEVL